MFKRVLCLCVFALSLVLLTSPLSTSGEKGEKGKKDDPKYNNPTYVPTADEVIEKMFEMGKVNKNDVIFDLGCGDGRILYMAAKKFGAKGIGLELNPVRIREAMDQSEKYNVGLLVEIRHGDALRPKDLSDATVVVMYMFPEFMNLWFPIAKEKLKPGTRILSHDYSWDKSVVPGAWDPVATATVKSSSRDNHKVYYWVVPERSK